MVNDINWNSKWKWGGCEYHVQNKEDVNYADVKRSCEKHSFLHYNLLVQAPNTMECGV